MKRIVLVTLIFLGALYSCTKKAAPNATVDAANIYNQNCKCHGPTGSEGKAPNLTTLDLKKSDIAEIITHGKGRMPAFEDKLSGPEIEALSAFVVGLKK